MKDFLGIDVAQRPAPAQENCTSRLSLSLDAKYFAAAAAYMRDEFTLTEGSAEVLAPSLSRSDVLEWMDIMEQHCKAGTMHHVAAVSQSGKQRVKSFHMEALITMVRCAGLLRSDGNLRSMLNHTSALIGMPTDWLSSDAAVPAASTISKHRFTLDCAFSLLVRARLKSWITEGKSFSIVFLWDSSPRGGREWLLGEMYLVLDEDLPEFCRLIDELGEYNRAVEKGFRERDEHFERSSAQSMFKMVWHFVLPTVCLGARAMSLADKFVAALHALRILSDCWSMCKILVQSCVGLCCDLGTESKLGSVPIVDANKLYPHWCETGICDDVAELPSMPFLVDGLMSLNEALVFPGLEHICHNIEQAVLQSLPSFKRWFGLASELARLLEGKFYTQRMSETVFNVRGAEWINKQCASFNAVPYEKRFGTLVDFCDHVMPLQSGLRHFWDASVFMHGDHAVKAPADDDDKRADVAKVTEAIQSDWFWSYCAVVVTLSSCLEELRNFSRSCPCHGHGMDLEADISTYRRRRGRWQKATGLDKPCCERLDGGSPCSWQGDGHTARYIRTLPSNVDGRHWCVGGGGAG